MENKVHVLTPNKNSTKYFGVDFFAQLCTGYNPTYRLYSTTMDFNAVYRNELVSLPDIMLDSLKIELHSKAKNSIIGITNNPDIYEAIDSIKPLLDILSTYDMGLFLETNSEKMIDDIDILKKFSEKHPLIIAVPVSGKLNYGNQEIFPDNALFSNVSKTLRKLAGKKLNFGVLYKPVVPYMNDDIDSFTRTIADIIKIGVKFIYPSFSMHFDSAKLKAFYDLVDKNSPELKNRFLDHYGQKYSWMSNVASELKKEFVFMCRKDKVIFSMKDIINLYKPDMHIQLKLF